MFFFIKMPTNNALLEIGGNIQDACDKDNFACGVFVDIKKSFDTVKTNILLFKINHGVRGSQSNQFKP